MAHHGAQAGSESKKPTWKQSNGQCMGHITSHPGENITIKCWFCNVASLRCFSNSHINICVGRFYEHHFAVLKIRSRALKAASCEVKDKWQLRFNVFNFLADQRNSKSHEWECWDVRMCKLHYRIPSPDPCCRLSPSPSLSLQCTPSQLNPSQLQLQLLVVVQCTFSFHSLCVNWQPT